MRTLRVFVLVWLAALSAAFVVSGREPHGPSGRSAGNQVVQVTGTVTSATDGDTLRVDGLAVRLIGIDAPETRRPGSPVECFGPEASRAVAALLPVGSRVRIDYDAERRDRFGRDLGYVYRSADGLFVNAWLVEHGFARVATYPPNLSHQSALASAEQHARTGHRGLWSACGHLSDQLPPSGVVP